MILLFYDCGYDLRRDSLIRFTLNVILIFVKSELLEEPAISFVNLSVMKIQYLIFPIDLVVIITGS